MNTYNLNYNQLRQQPEISEMLSALERGLTKYRIDFYLVGAVARDVWMSGINKIEPRRTTRDIDFDMYDEEIYNNHLDLFGEEAFELKALAARVMGREIKKIAKRNPKLQDRVISILERNTNDELNSSMAIVMIEYFKNTLEDNLRLLHQIKRGFEE